MAPTPLPAPTPSAVVVPTAPPTFLALETPWIPASLRFAPFLPFLPSLEFGLKASETSYTSAETCAFSEKGSSSCETQVVIGGKKSNMEVTKGQLVLEVVENVGSIQTYPLESTKTDFKNGDETAVDSKEVTKFTYDSLWRPLKKVVSTTFKQTIYTGDDVATKDVTSTTETTYTCEGQTHRLKTETTTENGETQKKVVYTY